MFNKGKRVFLGLAKYLRVLVQIKIKRVNNSQVWLLSERGVDARDNAFAMYQYLKKIHPEVSIKYVISKKSPDFDKIDSSDVVEYGSEEHYILFLTAGKLISTHIMGFSPDMGLFRRLDECHLLRLKGKRIFLQHGITKDAIPMLRRQKLDLFICGADPEYKFLLDYTGFSKATLKYTGFARYDTLNSQPRKRILVMPTFRRNLVYSRDFKSSAFYKKWLEFLKNPELKDYLERTGQELVFYLHHELQKNLKDFKCADAEHIKIASEEEYDIQELIASSNTLITDYSSIFFDFAYLKKPVIYYQFDYADYRKDHYKEGYFSYREDGFGPVIRDAKGVVETLADNRQFDKRYNDRADRFFILRDKNNRERIFKEISRC